MSTSKDNRCGEVGRGEKAARIGWNKDKDVSKESDKH